MIETHPAGAVLTVRVQAGARQNAIRGLQNGALKVAVIPVAERGRANQAVIRLLSRKLGLPKSRIECLSGATSAQKRLLIRTVTPDQLQLRLRDLLGESPAKS